MFQIQNSANSLNQSLREAPGYMESFSTRILPYIISTPPPQANERFQHIFFAENENNFEAAILTLGMDILTMTIVEN